MEIVSYMLGVVIVVVLIFIACDIRGIRKAVERIRQEFVRIPDDDTWA